VRSGRVTGPIGRGNRRPIRRGRPTYDVTVGETNLAWGTLFDLAGSSTAPLHVRLAGAIRTAIRRGRVPLGAALPPSRTLAAELHVSRWTVTQAYAQLITEGYLTGRSGSATRVTWSPSADEDQVPAPVRRAVPPRYDLNAGRPDLRSFPRRKWVQAIRATAESVPFDQLNYSEPGGHPRLRAVIAEHLNRSRAAAAQPGTVSIYAGAAQSLLQVSRALVSAGHTRIGVENPGSDRHWQAVRTAGLEPAPVPVDDDGLVVEALDADPGLRAVCVSAAHHPATGCVLAPHRRAALLDWARRVDALIVEDDYDAEFNYDRPAPPTVQGVDPDRVALIGSMSKSLGPTVGIGWVVAPRRWVDAVRSVDEISLLPPTLSQLALAHFMESGDYDRHLRACRRRFRARRAALVAALRRRLPECRIRGAEAGLHVLLELPAGADTAAIVAQAHRRDLQLCSLDEMCLQPQPSTPALLLGYSNLNDAVIDEAVTVLAAVISEVDRRR
jgi:GntR family transcriptional regulator/MocR family aminotransferase